MGEWPDIDWPSFPDLNKDTAIGVFNKETGEILIPSELDRIGSPFGNNLGVVENGYHSTQSERSICYIEMSMRGTPIILIKRTIKMQ